MTTKTYIKGHKSTKNSIYRIQINFLQFINVILYKLHHGSVGNIMFLTFYLTFISNDVVCRLMTKSDSMSRIERKKKHLDKRYLGEHKVDVTTTLVTKS